VFQGGPGFSASLLRDEASVPRPARRRVRARCRGWFARFAGV